MADAGLTSFPSALPSLSPFSVSLLPQALQVDELSAVRAVEERRHSALGASLLSGSQVPIGKRGGPRLAEEQTDGAPAED